MGIMKENKDFVFLNQPLPYLSDYGKSGQMNRYVVAFNPKNKAAKIFLELMSNLKKRLSYEDNRKLMWQRK